MGSKDTFMDARKTREIDFHNKRFAEETRGADEPTEAKGVDRFYSVVHQSRAFYVNQLKQSCAGKKVLEYGCGTGSHAPYLVKWGAQVTGIDISDVAIDKATAQARAQHIDGLDYFQMDAEALTFSNDSFDLICGTAILHHLDLTKAFAELARSLKPDGKAVFLEPLGHNPLINLYRKLTPGLRTPDEHPLLMKDFSLAKPQFGKIDLHFFNLFTLSAVPFRRFRWFPRVLNVLDNMDSLLFRVLPAAGRYAWTVVITLSQPAKGQQINTECRVTSCSL
jgi:SAM-dependent methyltransferase